MAATVVLGDEVYSLVLPRGRRKTWEWICEHIRTKDGVPFNPLDYPWGEGICDAWDDPDIKTVSLQTCARIGKTTIAMSIMMASIYHDPRPAMVGSSTETLLKEQIKDKYYRMLELCAPMREWLPEPHRRLQTRMDLKHCIVYGAWAGSSTQLSDKDPVYLHAGEIDKWTKNVSAEADPLYLFLERGAEQLDRKVLLESTPAIAGASRINRHYESGSARRLHVPCPHCGAYQRLVIGHGDGRGGVIWEKNADGESEPALAYSTARYQCCACHGEIRDEHRMLMVRAGIWVPRGQWVENGELKGTFVKGPEESFQLSRLYSPTFTFGDIAREYVASRDDMDRYRNFVNSWLGEVWVPRTSHAEWREVAQKLLGNYSRGQIPANCSFLTAAVDVQVDHWVWVIIGWTSIQQGNLVEYGHSMSWEDLLGELRRPRPFADKGISIPMLTLVDARDGNRTDEVIEFCRASNQPSGPWIWACMGTDGVHGGMGQRPFIRQQLTKSGKQRHAISAGLNEVECVKVNSGYYQNWIQNCLERRVPSQPNSLAIPRGCEDDEDLMRQLLNEIPEYRQDQTGHDRVQWARVTRSVPVDFRDAVRYARCAADVYLNNNWNRVVPRVAPAEVPASREVTTQKTPERSDGGIQSRRDGREGKGFIGGSGGRKWLAADKSGWLSSR